MTDKTVEIPVPTMQPFGIELNAEGVREVWDTFVVPIQEQGVQSVEDRMLMAILRAVYKGMKANEETE